MQPETMRLDGHVAVVTIGSASGIIPVARVHVFDDEGRGAQPHQESRP